MRKKTKDPLDTYLEEISKTPLLSHKEEIALAKKVAKGKRAEETLQRKIAKAQTAKKENGRLTEAEKTCFKKAVAILKNIVSQGVNARNRMIEANLRLVVSIAKNYFEDTRFSKLFLIQEGNWALFRAVKDFEFKRGYRFSTYATHKIRGGIGRAMQDKKTKEIFSLDNPFANEKRTSMAETMEDKKADCPRKKADENIVSQIVQQALLCLTEKEQKILQMHFWHHLTLAEIGKEIGVTREAIRMAIKRALLKLNSNASLLRLDQNTLQ